MKNYDFSNLLSPDEFQDLAVQILQTREKHMMECFRKVKDLGIDMRTKQSGKLVIGQAKRYSTYNSLYNSLKMNELPKVKKMKPDRYILITSVDLGPLQKQEIFVLFSDFIKEQSDIIGKADLNNLLSMPEYLYIIKQYPKLWLEDNEILEEMLDKVVNRKIYQSSKNELRNIIKNEETYIESEIYQNATKVLRKENCILITGEAGIGKTSLARHLCYQMLQENKSASFYYVYDLDSIFQVFQDEKNQVFFLDDFWGSIFKENTDKTEEKKFSDLICMFEEDKTKKLILTSRDYILREGFKEHPKIEQNFREETNRKILLQLEKFSEEVKIQIFFSHLRKSRLQWKMKKQLVDNYKTIITHQGFNPRLIVDFLRKTSNDVELGKIYDVYQGLIKYLENPKDFIKDIFEEQSQGAKLLLMLLLTMGKGTYLNELENMFYDYMKYENSLTEKADFNICMQELTNDFLRQEKIEIGWKKNPVIVTFQNPSFEEYVYEYFIKHSKLYIDKIINSTRYINVLRYMVTNQKLGDNSQTVVDKIIKDYSFLIMTYEFTVFDRENEERSEADKLIRLINLNRIIKDNSLKKFLINKIQNLINCIEKEEIALTNADLDSLITLLVIVKNEEKFSVQMDGAKLIEAYAQNIRLAQHYNIINHFELVFPEEYDEFMQENYRRINQLLPELILSNINQYKERGDYKEISYLVDTYYEELQDFYSLPIDRKFESILRATVKKYDGFQKKRTIRLEKTDMNKLKFMEKQRKEVLGELVHLDIELNKNEIETIIEDKMKDLAIEDRQHVLERIRMFSYQQLQKGIEVFSEKEILQDENFREEPELLEILISCGIMTQTKQWIQYTYFQLQPYFVLQEIGRRGDSIENYITNLQKLIYAINLGTMEVLLKWKGKI